MSEFRLSFFFQRQFHLKNNRLNGQYTLDNIASCLFGIDTNSLQNENVTLIKHLRKFFEIDFTNIYIYITSKSISMKINFCFCFWINMSISLP